MKVGQQRIHDPKIVAGIDEHVRLSVSGLYATFVGSRSLRKSLMRSLTRGVLQRSNGGCADRDYAPAILLRVIDRVCGVGRNFVPFPVQLVVFNSIDTYGLKGSKSDV